MKMKMKNKNYNKNQKKNIKIEYKIKKSKSKPKIKIIQKATRLPVVFSLRALPVVPWIELSSLRSYLQDHVPHHRISKSYSAVCSVFYI